MIGLSGVQISEVVQMRVKVLVLSLILCAVASAQQRERGAAAAPSVREVNEVASPVASHVIAIVGDNVRLATNDPRPLRAQSDRVGPCR